MHQPSPTLETYTPPLEPYLDVVHQDDHILVLNKPSGLLTVPGKHAHLQDCLEYRAREAFATATCIHRLDMDTSGLLVMALTPEAHAHIGRQFEKRQTEKSYIARVYGRIEQDEGVVDLPLRCDWPNRPKQMVDHMDGRPALTHWQVLDRGTEESRLLLRPKTGRSHQLRVHMMSLGHPILGDPFYAHETAKAMGERLQLHAERLAFVHPGNKERVRFHAPRSVLKSNQIPTRLRPFVGACRPREALSRAPSFWRCADQDWEWQR